MADLNDVKSINSRQIKLLQENGISTAEALAMSPHSEVANIEGLGEKTAKKLIWNARNALGMTEFTTASQISENIELITTGSSELNRILGGGIQTGKLTEVYGPFKSGKTALAHTISVTVQLSEKKGGLNGAVAYILCNQPVKQGVLLLNFQFRPHRKLNVGLVGMPVIENLV